MITRTVRVGSRIHFSSSFVQDGFSREHTPAGTQTADL